MWYPNFVLTGGSVYTGLSMLLTGKANAASWKGPTMEPLVIQPKSPWKKEPSGLGFENLAATAALSAGRVGDVGDVSVGEGPRPGRTEDSTQRKSSPHGAASRQALAGQSHGRLGLCPPRAPACSCVGPTRLAAAAARQYLRLGFWRLLAPWRSS